MLKTMLKGRGIHVNKLQLEKFLLFVKEVCPWFPEKATVRTGHATTDWFQIGKGVHQSCILSPCLFSLYAEYIM